LNIYNVGKVVCASSLSLKACLSNVSFIFHEFKRLTPQNKNKIHLHKKTRRKSHGFCSRFLMD